MYFIILSGCNKITPYVFSAHLSLADATYKMKETFKNFKDETDFNLVDEKDVENNTYNRYFYRGDASVFFPGQECCSFVDVFIFRRDDGECNKCLQEIVNI